jgi:hypothetical protein
MSDKHLIQVIGRTEDSVIASTAVMVNTSNTLMSMLKTIAQHMPRTSISTGIVLTGGDLADVFTVTGGYILLQGMTVVITTAVSANAALIGFVHDPPATYGASTTDIATETASADIQSAAIGDMFAADLDATAVVKYAHGTALAPHGKVHPGGLVLPPGGIDITLSTSDPTTGAGDAIVFYTPLTANAYVVAN